MQRASDNEWLEERRARLTASNFGLVCRRRAHSSCIPVVKQLLYTDVDCASTRMVLRRCLLIKTRLRNRIPLSSLARPDRGPTLAAPVERVSRQRNLNWMEFL
ncbi:hypothetical protein J6590_065978 [Homalodisca vitripennis]|nr:hypothetical protein J6590_065978 [Homalodisca vitripennis]